MAQLPLELTLSDHNGVEKTGRLPASLSTEGAPDGADPDVGAIGYYAPGNDLVLYYGDQSYFAGIVVIGRMGDGFERLRTSTATSGSRSRHRTEQRLRFIGVGCSHCHW